MCTKNQLNEIIGKIVAFSKGIFGDKITEIILFGSYARGDYHEHSDIDILLVADIKDDEVMQYVYQFSEFLSDLSLEYDIVISPVIEPLEKYKRLKDVLPFFQNIQKEGVHIAA